MLENSPRTPALLPRNDPLRVQPFKILLIRNLMELEVPRGRENPSLKPQAPPMTKPGREEDVAIDVGFSDGDDAIGRVIY